MAEMQHESVFEYVYCLILDLFIFFIKSIYFISESIILTLIPNRYRNLKSVSGQVVLITGGGGGVGRHLALNFAKLNSRVVIWDINREALNSTVEALNNEGFPCSSYLVDVSDRENVYAVAQKVKDDIGNVDILVNNAGIVNCRTFLDIPDKAIEKTFGVNILSNYWTVKAFLPEMMATNTGHIVTVGSVTGLMGTYACTDYSATKFACIGFHESLFTELRTHNYDNIHLTLVCPYYIATGMFAGVKPRMMPMLEPKYVADKIVDSVRKNEVNCTMPDSIRIGIPLKNLLPAKMCWEMMIRVMKVPQSMMSFRGNGSRATGG